jgi:K+-sensing histidine kinase KdpD
MLHAAQQASLGNIALELSRGFLQSLTAMRTATDLLTESLSSEDDRDGIAIISRNAEWLASQVRRFNSLAQNREDSVETVQLSKFIEQSLGLLSGSIENRGVRINTEFNVESTCVLLNGAALARTFLDLISCAVRTVKRGATIEISIDETEPSHVACSITHTSSAGQVFNVMGGETFQNSLPASKDHPTYTLAQRTVQSCGGKLVLEALDGGVNVFRIVLPRNAIEGQSLVGAPA